MVEMVDVLDGEFKFITEERWFEFFSKHGESVPNESNSDYYERKVNFFVCLSEDEMDDSEDISSELNEMGEKFTNKLKKSRYKSMIEEADYDTDDDNGIVFVDVILKEDIKEDELVYFLKYVSENY